MSITTAIVYNMGILFYFVLQSLLANFRAMVIKTILFAPELQTRLQTDPLFQTIIHEVDVCKFHICRVQDKPDRSAGRFEFMHPCRL